MGIQSTIEISREDATQKALMIFSQSYKDKFEIMSDVELEEYIEETFYHFRITK